jgi:hypothetical protein
MKEKITKELETNVAELIMLVMIMSILILSL